MTPHYKLANGISIPSIGLGTFNTNDYSEIKSTLSEAIKVGYRSFDCAARYQNQDQIGKALQEIRFPREELFITSKLWPDQKGYQNTLDEFDRTLKDLQLDYLDLYLIHWPIGKDFKTNWKEVNRETWRAFEELYRAGKIKAIGVSNFLPHHLEALLDHVEIAPMVNQLEVHPGYPQKEATDFCQNHQILVEAWSPLGRGRIFQSPELLEIAKKHDKTLPQICLRWILQKGMRPLPKSVTPVRIAENFDVFQFELSPEEMEIINNLPEEGFSGQHPDTVEF